MKDKHIKMHIYIRIEITNGMGNIIEPCFEKDFMSSLIKETNGAIQPLLHEYPHFTKNYPDNGWISYYYDVDCDVEVNISQLLRDQVGCFAPFAKLVVHSQDIANKIRDNLRETMDKTLLNLKNVTVTLQGEKYYK